MKKLLCYSPTSGATVSNIQFEKITPTAFQKKLDR
jgi:hypothetical protein